MAELLEAGKVKIVFFGNFGRNNFGNESTLHAILYRLRDLAPDAEYTCVCSGPENVAGDYNVAAIPISGIVIKPWNVSNALMKLARKLLVGVPSELYRWCNSFIMLRNTDVLIIPGTGLLTDAYGLFDWGPYNIFKWSVIAKVCRCKVFFVSVGAGPVFSRLGKFLVKAALSLADYRSYRDESTRECVESLGLRTNNDLVYPDLVFSLPTALIPDHHHSKGRRLVVGLGLMEYAGKYGLEAPGSPVHTPYLETLVEFAQWLLARGYDIRLLIGDLADTPVVQEFRYLLKKRAVTHEPERIIDEPIISVDDLLSALADTDMVVATRFHNVLLALLLNKPVIAISFHHKCSSLMDQMGLAEYCQDINGLKAENLIRQVCQIEESCEGLQWMIKEKVVECRQALDEQYCTIFRHLCPSGAPILSPAIATRSDPKNIVLS
jgi:polysaccharide pyruvyl transferase WcaK-like protein